jgi:hypothetical protein
MKNKRKSVWNKEEIGRAHRMPVTIGRIFEMHFLKNEALISMNKEWATSTNWNSRDEAVVDFVSSYKISKKVYTKRLEEEQTRLRKQGFTIKNAKTQALKNISEPMMKFKSKKKKLQQSFFIRSRDWNADGNAAWLRKIRTKCKYLVAIDYDTRIVKVGSGRFYVSMLKPLEKLNESTNSFEKVIRSWCESIYDWL